MEVSRGAEMLAGTSARNKILQKPLPDKSAPSYKPIDTMQAFTDKAIAAVGALGEFISSLKQSTSAVSGALGGGMSGASLGSAGGPLGAVIGAAAGATLGAIVGHKNAVVKTNITDLQSTYKTIMTEFAQNTNNLNITIGQLQVAMQQAEQLQASSKKGSSEYEKIVVQYMDQITTLQNQQSQIVRDMNTQLALLQLPEGAQGYLSTLQDILQQYEKFEGAAKTTTELANANLYLIDSMKQYELNLENQLATDNEQAINDALQLNDLLYQRQQSLLQYNNQIQGMLSQGVLTRQNTRAQTVGQQVYQAQIEQQRQMEQINEQIAAAQYKVNAEQQVFNLASTRVGLEMQLLSMQNAQTNLDMQRIVALQSLVNQLASGNYGTGVIAALIAATQNPSLLTGALTGTPPVSVSGVDALETMVSDAYDDRANLGYGDYRGQNL